MSRPGAERAYDTQRNRVQSSFTDFESSYTQMNQTSNSNPLSGLWNGIHTSMKGRLDSVREYLRHPASGQNTENYFRDLLRSYLPRRYEVEPGFVVNVEGDRSDFIDILIVDCMNIPPLSAEPHFKVFPAEAVVGAIEITSAPKSQVKRSGIANKISKLEDDILKLAKLRTLAKKRRYLDTVPVQTTEGIQLKDIKISYSLSPRSYLITCGDEWTRPGTYEKNLLAALNDAKSKNDGAWINAALSMQHGVFHFTPYTNYEHGRINENAMLEFILMLNNAISEFKTSRIDMRRYRPTLPPKEETRENQQLQG